MTPNEAAVVDDSGTLAASGESHSPADGGDNQTGKIDASRPRRRPFRYTLPGCWVALGFVCLAFTPSLVPRPGPFQGVVCGLTGAIGYGLGVVGAWLWRQFADRSARQPKALAWRIFGIVAVVGLLTFYLLGQRWQGQIRALVGAEPEDLGSRLILPVLAGVVFVGLVAAGRGVRKLYRWVARRLNRWMGARAARALGWVLAAVLTVGLFSGVLVDGILAITDRAFAIKDTTTSDTVDQPTTPLRSGGPGSLIGWDTLGYQGRNFAGSGPTAAQISTFSGAHGAGADPGLRRDQLRRHRAGPGCSGGRRPAACWWLRPQLLAGHRDDGNGLGGPGRDERVRVRNRWRQCRCRDPVLLSAVVGVVPGRPGQGARGRPGLVRRGVPGVVGAAGGPATQDLCIRAEPRLVHDGDPVRR